MLFKGCFFTKSVVSYFLCEENEVRWTHARVPRVKVDSRSQQPEFILAQSTWLPLSLKYLPAPRRLKAKGSEPASCLSCEMAGLMCYLSSQQAPRSTPLSASRVRPHRPLPFLPTLWSLRGPWCRPFQDGDKTPLHLSSWVHSSGSEGALQGRFLTLVLLPFP